ncbi:MAG: PIN domain-containing protein [Propionibacteriales bacterium]|nr:PIN domain-containing protein [Propionibacteriales bacterium]
MADDIVLVDTDVWSCVVMTDKNRDPRVEGWRRALLGKQITIAAQTEGELRFGADVKGWGPTHVAQLEAKLATTPTILVDSEVIKAFANIRAECRKLGHALADKQHMGDAWIAATGRAHGLALLSGDAIYAGALGVLLLAPSAG